MSGRLLKSVLKEYGIDWAVNRSLYSGKLKLMSCVPGIDKIFEKNAGYPSRLNLFEVDTSEVQKFLKNLPKDKREELVNIADNACEGKILGFSSIELNYGNPLNWQLNPLTGKSCDIRKKWYEIPDFDSERGDIKVIWEASRFSHFITLARAYLLTDDGKYHRAFSKQLSDWIEKNPYPYGANFKCGQECSLRMVNALLAYTVFLNARVSTDADKKNIEKLILRCYRRVRSNFFYAYKCIKNNHTISELMGIIVGAWCCGEDGQIRHAYHTLNEVIDKQFTDDGGYTQFSFNYQRLALQDLEVVMSISGKVRMGLSRKSIKKMRKAAELMHQCQDETGDMPNYGSNDGALVFPVTSCGYRDFRPVINTAFALSSGKQLYGEGLYQEELIWFSGGKKIEDYSIGWIGHTSSQFPNAGLFTIRGKNLWAMIVSNDYHTRPAHMDQNHFDFWVNGVNVLCDAGTYSYASELGGELIKNGSHNTAVVEDRLQMSMHGPFMIYDWTKRKLGKIDSHSFESTIISANGYKHKRKVMYKDGGFEIDDVVDRNFTVVFHTPCEVVVQNRIALLKDDEKVIASIISDGEIEVESSKRSMYYLKDTNTRNIRVYGKANENVKTIIRKYEGDNYI